MEDSVPSEPWLVRHKTEWRQIGIVSLYVSLLLGMYFVPALRNPVVFVLACLLSFLNAVVIHNHLHKGIFHSKGLNMFWRLVLSFGALYPASTNVPTHNLVHHRFEDDGQPDWGHPSLTRFRWNLLNLLYWPNANGPEYFDGTTRWIKHTRKSEFARQWYGEQAIAFGLTGVMLAFDFWTALLFVVLPQLYGARCILRINLIQHDGTNEDSRFNHSRNFVGRFFNWVMCNNGYHTIHHNRPGLHWSELADEHERTVKPHIHPSLDQASMVGYLARTYLFNLKRPQAPGEVPSHLRESAAGDTSKAA